MMKRCFLSPGLVTAGICFFSLRVLAGSAPWTLPQAVMCAWTNNPDALLAEHRVEAAREFLRQAEASFWPRLQFQSGYARTDNPVGVFSAVLNQQEFSLTEFDLNNPPVVDNLNIKGLATLPLYAGGSITAAKEAALAQARASQEEAIAIRDQVAFEVARTFFTILKARELIRAADSAVRAFEKNLELSNQRFRAGTILRAEVLDMEVRLAQGREDLVRTRNAQALAERAFRNLLGLEQTEVSVAELDVEVSIPEGRDFSRRTELRAAKQRIEAAQWALREARSGYLPRVDAFASYDYDRGWEMGGAGESWTAGALLQWDLWDGQRTRGRVGEARANLRVAQELERKLRLSIDLEIEQASLRLGEARERLTVTERAVTQAAESVELTRSRFEQGLVLATQLIDSETALTAARVRRAEAEADRRIAIASLRRALGQPQVQDPLPSP